MSIVFHRHFLHQKHFQKQILVKFVF